MEISTEKLKFFAQLIEKKVGIVYAEANFYQLEHRLKDISTLLGLSGVDELWSNAQIGLNSQALALLLDLSTNNETSFFRDGAIFAGIENLVIPELQKRSPGLKSVSIWTAATSTGQEPYSIAMIMELAKARDVTWPDYQILCTDLSERVLKRAEAGVYSQLEVQRGLPARNLVQFFTKPNEAEWQIRPELKSKLRFKQLNLLEDWGHHETYDIIFCRNVLIYQSVENKKKVIDRMAKRLAPGGFLALGASESLLGISEEFDQAHFQNAVFYKKRD